MYGWAFVAIVFGTIVVTFLIVQFAFERSDASRGSRSITYTINHQRGRVYQVARGDLGPDEFVATLDRQAGDGEAWHYGTVLDLSAATLAPALTTLEKYSRHARELEGTHGARGPLAIVTDAHAPDGETGAFCEAVLSNGLAVGTFTSLQQAERCLDTAADPGNRR